jgi:microcystin-dependent protein
MLQATIATNQTDREIPQVPVGAPLIGSIVGYGCIVDVTSPPPDGWLLCDGHPVSRSTYAALFQAIGTLHGGGDGVNTFNLPDYRGRFQRGVDDGTGRDPNAATRYAANVGGVTGDVVGSIENRGTALPTAGWTTNRTGDHVHSVPHLPKDSSWYKIAGSHYAAWNSDSRASTSAGAHTHTVNGGGDVDTCPVNVYANYLIFYGNAAG